MQFPKRCVLYSLEYRTMEKVQKPSNSVYYTSSSEPFRIYENPVRTSQETHYVSLTKPSRLMLFRETVAVYCENYIKRTNTHGVRRMRSFSVL
jgi:hypothetical protein